MTNEKQDEKKMVASTRICATSRGGDRVVHILLLNYGDFGAY